MIELREIRKDVFELKESILDFSDPKKTNWYWDLNRRLISEKPDFPDSMLTRELTNEQLDTFEKHYRLLIIRKTEEINDRTNK